MNQGEVIQLGHHRLLCGDAFNPEHVDALMQGEKPAMLYCDPPYGIGLKSDWLQQRGARTEPVAFKPSRKNANAGSKNHPPVVGDSVEFAPHSIIDRFSTTKEQFWWGANNYISRVPDAEKGSWLVWDKRREGPIDRMLGSHFELCWSKKTHRYEMCRVIWVGIIGQNGIDLHRHHPTQKPVKLAEWFLERFSKPDALILDLFGGAGGTLLACERLNRTCYMAEISPDYCDVIIQRYERMTQQPKLLEVG